MNTEVEKLIVDIIATEMSIDSQNIWIGSQNIEIPNTEDLFIIVSMIDTKVISNRNTTETTETTITEYQEVLTRENIQIDIMSSTNEARQKRVNIIMALKSITSQQSQEANNFRIYRIPSSFVNSTEAEGGSQLNKYSIVIPVMCWYRKSAVLSSSTSDYFDTFTTRADMEDTIGETEGAIEFTITE